MNFCFVFFVTAAFSVCVLLLKYWYSMLYVMYLGEKCIIVIVIHIEKLD